MVPEEHPSSTTTFKELKSRETPPSANISSGHSTAPTVQAIVVNCVAIVNPQFAPIIGDNLEVVTARLEDSQAASPTHSEVVTSGKTRPSSTSVFIVHHLTRPFVLESWSTAAHMGAMLIVNNMSQHFTLTGDPTCLQRAMFGRRLFRFLQRPP
jgi:hypothetical protein